MTPSFEPALEMLWETDDPAAALSDRFGFDDAAAAGQWVATALSDVWGIAVDSCDRIVMSDHNALAWTRSDGNGYILKWSVVPERFSRLASVAELTAWLGGGGVPVSAPVAALDGRVHVERDGVSMGLQHHVAGHLLDVTRELEVRAAGSSLARLHDALAHYLLVEQISQNTSGQRQIETRIVAWLDSERSRSVPGLAKRELRRRAAQRSAGALTAQLVHGDFRSANLLVDQGRVVAIIDFEEARQDVPVVELAHAAVLLGTRFREWAPVSSEVRRWFLAGYQSVRPLDELELEWWDTLVLWFSLMFIPTGEDPMGWRAAAMELV